MSLVGSRNMHVKQRGTGKNSDDKGTACYDSPQWGFNTDAQQDDKKYGRVVGGAF